MALAASDLTGWWIGWALGAVAVLVVAVLVLSLTATARSIAAIAEDATRALVLTRERTEALWLVNDTNAVLTDILGGAVEARLALSGNGGSKGGGHAHSPEEDLKGSVSGARRAVEHSLPTGPDLDPEEGTP